MTVRLQMAVLAVWLVGVAAGEGNAVMNSAGATGTVHVAHGAGRWFPADGRPLRADVKGYIDQARVPAARSRVLAGIAPHAGFPYSGPVAGWTFRAVRESIAAGHAVDTVVVLGFSHREAFRGTILMDGDGIRTPLGTARLDTAGARALAGGGDRIRIGYGPHEGEHSAENEIPFVQVAAPDALLIVGLVGDHESATLDALVDGLVALSRAKRLLVIASTDLLHDADYERVTSRDRTTLETIVRLDHAALAARWSYRDQVCCGIGPVLAVMRYAEKLGCRGGALLRYRNSGDEHPESRGHWVVGYGAVVFAADEAAGNAPRRVGGDL